MARLSTSQIILDYLKEHGEITSEKAHELCKHNYYNNHEKYVSETFSRLVNSGKVIRIKKGLFKLSDINVAQSDPNQQQLF